MLFFLCLSTELDPLASVAELVEAVEGRRSGSWKIGFWISVRLRPRSAWHL